MPRTNDGRIVKREKDIKEFKVERPRRAVISEKEALKRMKEFSKRKEQFLATARTGKSSVLACIVFVIFAMPAYSQSLSPGAHDFSGKYSSWWQFGGGSITLEADGTFRN